MAIDSVLLYDLILLGGICVVGVVLTVILNRYCREGCCLCIGDNGPDDERHLVEHQDGDEIDSDTVTSKADNNGYQPTEGGIAIDVDDDAGAGAEKQTRSSAGMTEGKPSGEENPVFIEIEFSKETSSNSQSIEGATAIHQRDNGNVGHEQKPQTLAEIAAKGVL